MSETIADYTVAVRPDDVAFVAYGPAIVGCHAVGNSPEEARVELDNVFAMIEEEYAERGDGLPRDVSSLTRQMFWFAN